MVASVAFIEMFRGRLNFPHPTCAVTAMQLDGGARTIAFPGVGGTRVIGDDGPKAASISIGTVADVASAREES